MRLRLLNKWTTVGVAVVALLGLGAVSLAHADEEPEDDTAGKISISISPVTENFQLNSDSVYDGVMNVTNAGSKTFDFEVYSAPYSFSFSETTNDYDQDFNSENSYTQIARWISIQDQSGNYVSSYKDDENGEATHPIFTAEPGETVAVAYRITTPSNIPAGGQYAVLFAQTIAPTSETSGISTSAQLGMKIFGRSDEGEAIQSAEIMDMSIKQSLEKETDVNEGGETVRKNVTFNNINGSAKIKNTGNLDFGAHGVLKVTNIFGQVYYETPDDKAQISVIPESERPISDEWTETPGFGLFMVSWTVTAGEDSSEISQVICLIPPYVIIITIILLTIIIASIILVIRRRKERRSRFTV